MASLFSQQVAQQNKAPTAFLLARHYDLDPVFGCSGCRGNSNTEVFVVRCDDMTVGQKNLRSPGG